MLANLRDAEGRGDAARRLDGRIDQLWAAYSRRRLAGRGSGPATPEELDALRSLGYVR
jgi:hypothetical protein